MNKFKITTLPENYNNQIKNKFLTVETENKDFKKLFDVISKNMMHYFSMCLNTKEKVHKSHAETDDRWADINVCYAPKKDDCEEVSDVKNQNSSVYKNFIENLMRKAHDRVHLPFIDYIPEKNKKADFIFSDFFDNKKISVTYFTSPIMLSMSFNEETLNIVYLLNHSDAQKMMLDININHNQQIISTEVFFNGDQSNETEMISLNTTQLDYLIVLSHYTDGESIDFIAEQYVDDILAENYENFINYIKLKEMLYI